jgi:hypothetical protein
MKRIGAVLVVLLGSVSFSAADSLTLNYGEGTMFGFATFPSYQFLFLGPNAAIVVETGPFGLLGDWPDAPGLQNCVSCDPLNQGSILLYDSGNTGLMEFDAVSFVSSLAPSGDLTVIYTATARMFFETDKYGSLCDPGADSCPGPNLAWDQNIRWLVTAQYAPDSSSPGSWNFLNATFTPAPTPEPSSILLMGSGMVILITKFRRKLVRPFSEIRGQTERSPVSAR